MKPIREKLGQGSSAGEVEGGRCVKFIQMTYSRGATVNQGNYNSARVEVSATIEVGEKEKPDDQYLKLRDWVEQKVKLEVRELNK